MTSVFDDVASIGFNFVIQEMLIQREMSFQKKRNKQWTDRYIPTYSFGNEKHNFHRWKMHLFLHTVFTKYTWIEMSLLLSCTFRIDDALIPLKVLLTPWQIPVFGAIMHWNDGVQTRNHEKKYPFFSPLGLTWSWTSLMCSVITNSLAKALRTMTTFTV